MKIAECERCGRGIGFKAETLCFRCRAADREAALRAPCPSCGRFLRLQPDTGRCIRCSRVCVDCGHVLRYKASTRCLDCRRKWEEAKDRSLCPKCGRQGRIRPTTGWCGICSRPPSPPLPLKPCTQCGQLARKKGEGICLRCWTRSPTRPITQAENIMATTSVAPEWLTRFAEFAVARHCVPRACLMVSAVGQLILDGESTHPQAMLERARLRGRSEGALARTLEQFLVGEGLAFGLDQQTLLARGRRQRRVDAAPVPLRPAVAAFADHLVRSQERARRAGTRPRTDSTIEKSITTVRDLAKFLDTERHKEEWSTVESTDIDAFLLNQPGNRDQRLGESRQFFRWARKNKLVLVDPTRYVTRSPRRGFTGETLTIGEQRRLFRRWTTDPDVHPHEALVGVFALLHAASNAEIRGLMVDDVDRSGHALRIGRRAHPVPLDPASSAVLQRSLEHRSALGTHNPHVMVTTQTKTRSTPASSAYVTHVLDAAKVSPKQLRSTRIVDLVTSLDLKVVSEALGMKAEGLVDYLADHVDPGRLSDDRPNLGTSGVTLHTLG